MGAGSIKDEPSWTLASNRVRNSKKKKTHYSIRHGKWEQHDYRHVWRKKQSQGHGVAVLWTLILTFLVRQE